MILIPKARKDYLVTLNVVAGDNAATVDSPHAEISAMTLIPRIVIDHGTGKNCVAFRYGHDFKIQADRVIAERLRDDLIRWLEKNPAATG